MCVGKHPHFPIHYAEASRYPTPKQGSGAWVQLGHHGGHPIFGNHRIFRKRGNRAGADCANLTFESGRLRFDPESLPPMEYNVLPWFYLANPGALLDDLGESFMSEEMWEKAVGSFDPRDFIELRSTNPAGDHAYQDLAFPQGVVQRE